MIVFFGKGGGIVLVFFGELQRKLDDKYKSNYFFGGRFVNRKKTIARCNKCYAHWCSVQTFLLSTKSSATAASGVNVVAIQTTITEKHSTQKTSVDENPRAKVMFYLDCVACVLVWFYDVCKEIMTNWCFSADIRISVSWLLNSATGLWFLMNLCLQSCL